MEEKVYNKRKLQKINSGNFHSEAGCLGDTSTKEAHLKTARPRNIVKLSLVIYRIRDSLIVAAFITA